MVILLSSYSKGTVMDDSNHNVINDKDYNNEPYSSNHLLDKYAYSNYSRLLLVAGILLSLITNLFFLLIILLFY